MLLGMRLALRQKNMMAFQLKHVTKPLKIALSALDSQQVARLLWRRWYDSPRQVKRNSFGLKI